MREVGEDPLDEHEHIYFLFYQLEGGDDFNKLVGFDVFIFFYLIEDGVEVGDLYSCVLVLTVFAVSYTHLTLPTPTIYSV